MGNVISQTASILVWALESPIFRKSPFLHLAFSFSVLCCHYFTGSCISGPSATECVEMAGVSVLVMRERKDFALQEDPILSFLAEQAPHADICPQELDGIANDDSTSWWMNLGGTNSFFLLLAQYLRVDQLALNHGAKKVDRSSWFSA